MPGCSPVTVGTAAISLKAIVGVFKSRSDAERGAAELVPLEIPKDRINILTPEATDT